MINLSLSLTKSMSYPIIWMLFFISSYVFSANELHRRCSGTFSCGDQRELYYPFWTSSREDCGHPDFKLECNGGIAELNISSVKYRILEANFTAGVIRLARVDYIDDFCTQTPPNASFNERVLPLAPKTDLLTIYYECDRDLSSFTSTYVKNLDCGDGDRKYYYVTRNLLSHLLRRNRPQLTDFGEFCKINVTIPASRSKLDTLESISSKENLMNALDEGFELETNPDCTSCIHSAGACGYNQSSSRFVCYCIDESHSGTCGSRKKGLSRGAKAGVVAAASALVGVILIVTGLACVISCQRMTSDHLSKQNLKALIPLKHYSYAQVQRITKSFAEVVGKGGFGTVYRGTLTDSRSVAVKILKDSMGNGEDFINEVSSMSKTSHVNIVTLLGFCSEGSKKAIIYEFMENGSLDKLISGMRSSSIDWGELYKIALGVARGLEYLHHGCRTRIVHFDIKPQNVLLDENLCPKVSDFGLAKLCEKKESILSLLDTRGTIGYIAPELFSRMYGRVSHKSDVYSYGMLVLEMIGARNKPSTEDSGSEPSSMYFPEWIYMNLENRDNRRVIENDVNSEEQEIEKKMTLVGLWCIQSSPSDRPPMDRVVEMMEGNLNALEVPPRPVFQIPAAPLQESSTISENISAYTEGFP